MSCVRRNGYFIFIIIYSHNSKAPCDMEASLPKLGQNMSPKQRLEEIDRFMIYSDPSKNQSKMPEILIFFLQNLFLPVFLPSKDPVWIKTRVAASNSSVNGGVERPEWCDRWLPTSKSRANQVDNLGATNI